jgi:hypothetical protein
MFQTYNKKMREILIAFLQSSARERERHLKKHSLSHQHFRF